MTFYVYIVILIAFLLCTLTITVFWMKKRTSEIAVERMLGLKKQEIILQRLSHYVPLSFIGSGLGILAVFLLYQTGFLTVFSIMDGVITIFCTVFCSILIMLGVHLYFCLLYTSH